MVEMSVLGPADVRRALAAADCADIEIRFFAESTATAPQAAAAIGCELGQIIKSLAFLIAGEPCLVLMGGDGQVEERTLAAQYGVGRKRVRAANAAQCVEIFGYAPGAVPPVGLAVRCRFGWMRGCGAMECFTPPVARRTRSSASFGRDWSVCVGRWAPPARAVIWR